MAHPIIIREATDDDAGSVRAVVTDAFGQADEADLVERLVAAGLGTHSLVARCDGAVVGHVLLSRIAIVEASGASHSALALAPVSVLTHLQGQGIGIALIREAIVRARQDGHGIVIVVGEPAYYGRFGFSSAQGARLQTPYPGEAFQALELSPGALDGLDGAQVEYSAPFLEL